MGSVAGRKLSVFCMENCLGKYKFWSWPFGQLFFMLFCVICAIILLKYYHGSIDFYNK